MPLFDPGQVNAHWSETVVSWALPAAAWMVADSYRGMPWLAASHTAVGRDAL